MGTYILLVNSTDHGAKGVKEIPDRQEASRETARKLGDRAQERLHDVRAL